MLEIQGHRGARGLYPENTLSGIQAAAALGLQTVEIDVGVTADGCVVLSHDPALNPDLTRTRDGAWLEVPGPLLREVPKAGLTQYDMGRIKPGTRYAAMFPDQVAHDGAGIPALQDVLRAVPGLRFNIELKLFPDRPGLTVSPEEMVDRTLQAVVAADALGRVSLQSFDWRAPRYARRCCPSLAVGWLTCAATLAEAGLWCGHAGPAREVAAWMQDEGGGTWSPHYADLTQTAVAQAGALGLRVVPWTVNGPGDMRRLSSWGVDGLITDRPDRARGS